MNKNFCFIVLSVFAAGCGTEVHTYVINKPRLGYDQIANGGCLTGQCSPQPAPAETTRKVYVLELTRPVPESQVQKIESQAVSAITETTPTPSSSNAAIETTQTNTNQASSSSTSAAESQTYTVVKDDTLQKISKKLYGTYSKWYKLYEANKDKIKNPNFVKPGTVLTIPAIK